MVEDMPKVLRSHDLDRVLFGEDIFPPDLPG